MKSLTKYCRYSFIRTVKNISFQTKQKTSNYLKKILLNLYITVKTNNLFNSKNK